jgi:uncharacterized RDD family membrane protein YckC
LAVAEHPPTAIGLESAPFGARLAAFVLDWLVSFIIVSLFLAGAGLYLLLVSDMAANDVPDRALVTAVLVATLAAPVWCVVTLAGYTWHGRSPGKLAMNLRVVGRDHQPPGVWRAIIRLVVYVTEVMPLAAVAPVAALAVAWSSNAMMPQLLMGLSVALIVPTASLVLVLRDGRRRALHDIAAGTMVVRDWGAS